MILCTNFSCLQVPSRSGLCAIAGPQERLHGNKRPFHSWSCYRARVHPALVLRLAEIERRRGKAGAVSEPGAGGSFDYLLMLVEKNMAGRCDGHRERTSGQKVWSSLKLT